MSIELSHEDESALLSIAREAIRSRLAGDRPRWRAHSAALDQARGAFVTLHALSEGKRGALRGCIGRMAAEAPLHEVVRDMACAAAFEDPRFPPLTAGEFDRVEIEISVLSPFEPCSPEDVTPGIHGVYLIRGFRSGVFLPQVATEQGWDRETLLDQLCRKAGLDSGAYRLHDAKLFTFTATVFGEGDEGRA